MEFHFRKKEKKDQLIDLRKPGGDSRTSFLCFMHKLFFYK